MIDNFRVLDLFSGAGGFSYGIDKNSHFKTLLALDFNENALKTFKHNMPEAETVVGDITDSEIKKTIVEKSKKYDINMIIGGPPCQGFSLKGKKLGLEDSRNFLFKEYLNIVESVQPEIFIIENVKALLFPKPTSKKIVTVRDAISDLAYLNSGEGFLEQEYSTETNSEYQNLMRKGAKKLYNHKASNHAKIAIEKLKMIPPECGKEHLPKELLGNQKFLGTWGRLKWDFPSPTIDIRFDACSNGTNNHPFLNRSITPREAGRLQSFDDNFVFLGSKVQIRQQIGNAVPPLMAKAIADTIYKQVGE